MTRTPQEQWDRFNRYYFQLPSLGLALDLSRMNFGDDFLPSMKAKAEKALADMKALEGGAIANPDEKRMVGHYWLRNAALAPAPELRKEIEETLTAVKDFAANVHAGAIRGEGGAFRNILLIGIGGSALGPQLLAHALGHPRTDKMKVFFFDNTDPDGMEKALSQIGGELNQTLSLVISKSGGTKETRNGMLEAQSAYEKAGLDFAKHAVAVTGVDSQLDKFAQGWLARFPMWDWVGGRTSMMSAVGILPAALQGLDVEALLRGARLCDEATRGGDALSNPSMLLALMWHYAGQGRGARDMVILPYKDSLELFSKYLQQLVMESLGKGKDLAGNQVDQGVSVFGNKGSTDQHAYIQQLREGVNNFFVTFIQVLQERSASPLAVDPGVTSNNYLQGFLLGTRQALAENGRESITLVVDNSSAQTLGVLVALYERAVGFYASLINVNAYHQPGVEAGKKAAEAVLDLQKRVIAYLDQRQPSSAEEISQAVHAPAETVFKVCEYLAASPARGIVKIAGKSPRETRFQKQ